MVENVVVELDLQAAEKETHLGTENPLCTPRSNEILSVSINTGHFVAMQFRADGSQQQKRWGAQNFFRGGFRHS